jgi:hypothetical protein
MSKEMSFQITLKQWQSLPLYLRQELLLHLPRVWLVYIPYVKWFPWIGRFVPHNFDLK